MRFASVAVLCLVSGLVGAGLDHYWDRLASFTRSSGPETGQTKPTAPGGVEVLGDRVRCDVRYQELKLPESEYRTFFDRCMGNTGGTSKSE